MILAGANLPKSLMGEVHKEPVLQECGKVYCENEKGTSQTNKSPHITKKIINNKKSKLESTKVQAVEEKVTRNMHYDANHNRFNDERGAVRAFNKALDSENVNKALDIKSKNGLTDNQIARGTAISKGVLRAVTVAKENGNRAREEKIKRRYSKSGRLLKGSNETIRTEYDMSEYDGLSYIDMLHEEALEVNETIRVEAPKELTDGEKKAIWLAEVTASGKRVEEKQRKEKEANDMKRNREMEEFAREQDQDQQDEFDTNNKRDKVDLLSKERIIRRAIELGTEASCAKAVRLMERYGIKAENIVKGKTIPKAVSRRIHEALRIGDLETFNGMMKKYSNPRFVNVKENETIRVAEANEFEALSYEEIVDLEGEEELMTKAHVEAIRMDKDRERIAKESKETIERVTKEEQEAFFANVESYNKRYMESVVARYVNDPENQQEEKDPMEAVTTKVNIKVGTAIVTVDDIEICG